jgi:hypothetical protein
VSRYSSGRRDRCPGQTKSTRATPTTESKQCLAGCCRQVHVDRGVPHGIGDMPDNRLLDYVLVGTARWSVGAFAERPFD